MKHKEKRDPIESFEKDSIASVVIKNSIPALIAMIMVMVYNLADVFFIGLTHDDLQVAAVSLASPVFMIFMSLGTLFGVGGTSVISRALGAGKKEYAKKVSSFCMWGSVALGILLMAVLWIFMDKITVMLGANEETFQYASEYLTIVVGAGVFSMLSNCFSSIIRTEGAPMKAMTGTVIGNLINLILDPIMILGFKWGIVGAAVATVIGNAAATAYYLLYFLSGKSNLSIHPKHFSMKDGIFTGVMAIGISASLVNMLVSVSAIVVNSQLGKYADASMYQAGYGVSSKVIMIITLIGIGIGSGVQPFLGYCFGAKNKERLTKGIRFSALFATIACLIVSVLCYVFAPQIVNVFLTDDTALECGVHFTRILLTTAWLIGAFGICQNTLQAIGAATPALLASIIRQAVIFIPALFILQAAVGLDGLLWAQPVADVLSLIVVVLMLVIRIKKSDFTTVTE